MLAVLYIAKDIQKTQYMVFVPIDYNVHMCIIIVRNRCFLHCYYLRKETFSMAKVFKPGTDNQKPGEYIEVGPRGGSVDRPRVVHIDQGDRLPPTQESGHRWKKN